MDRSNRRLSTTEREAVGAVSLSGSNGYNAGGKHPKRLMTRLVDEGLLTRNDRGFYEITEAGYAALASS